MSGPRKGLKNRKTRVAMTSCLLGSIDEFMALDASLQKEGQKPLMDPESTEKDDLKNAQCILKKILIRARKIQREDCDAACKKFEESQQAIEDKDDAKVKT